MSSKYKYICISGYGWSGSGLYIDFLKSHNCIKALDFEFSLIKEPDGILDLSYSLIENWDVLRSNFSIQRFKKYCQLLNKKNKKFGSWGGNLSNELGVNFLLLSNQYIDRISEYRYRGSSRIHNYYLGDLQSIYLKITRKLKIKKYLSNEMHLSKPDQDFFIYETKKYLDDIFSQKFKDNTEYLILDQAIPTSNYQRAMGYLNNSKLIIVDRDPRDIYVNLINDNVLIGQEPDGIKRAEKFIKWHKKLREDLIHSSPYVLKLNFEDLILDFHDTYSKLKSFLDLKNPVIENKFYNFDVSRKNIGIWEHFANQNEIDLIYTKLIIGK
jgi:hypothetical protein